MFPRWEKDERSEINQLISKIREAIPNGNMQRYGEPIFSLIEKQTGYTIYIDFHDDSRFQEEFEKRNRDAFLVINHEKREGYVICKTSLMSKRNQLRKACYHELGHLFLKHRPYSVNPQPLLGSFSAYSDQREFEAERFSNAYVLWEHEPLLSQENYFSISQKTEDYVYNHLDFEYFCNQAKITPDIGFNLLLSTPSQKFHFLAVEYDCAKKCIGVHYNIPATYPQEIISALPTPTWLTDNETAVNRCLKTPYLTPISNNQVNFNAYTLCCSAVAYPNEQCICVVGKLS